MNSEKRSAVNLEKRSAVNSGSPIDLHVEYAEGEKEHGILFIFSPFYEYIPLEYYRVSAIYRIHQAEYVIHILVAVS